MIELQLLGVALFELVPLLGHVCSVGLQQEIDQPDGGEGYEDVGGEEEETHPSRIPSRCGWDGMGWDGMGWDARECVPHQETSQVGIGVGLGAAEGEYSLDCELLSSVLDIIGVSRIPPPVWPSPVLLFCPVRSLVCLFVCPNDEEGGQ